MTVKKKPQLGDGVKDLVTGFAGTVTGRSEYLNGCVHYCVEARVKLGAKPESIWIDEAQLEVTKSGGPLRRKLGLEGSPSTRKPPGGPAIHGPPNRWD